MKLRPLTKNHGGKFYLAKFIVSCFPKNYASLKYLEGCGGGASVLLQKQKSVTEIYNDADENLANIFGHCVNNTEQFIKVVEQLVYSEETFTQAQNTIYPLGSFEAAINELVLRRMSRGGLKTAFSWSERLRNNQPGDLNGFESFKQQLPLVAERLKDVQILCCDIKKILNDFNDPDWLIYLDPPYLPSTRKVPKVYGKEMTEKEHIELAELLQNVKSKVILSGYPSQLYMKLYRDWNIASTSIANHSGQNKKKEKRIELLWMNY